MSYPRINNIVGWIVFGIALITYGLTMSPTASFWDCGEFIACANELEVTHPPGAPLFLLLGRIFAMFSFGDPLKVAYMVNFISVFSGAFTALFTCWATAMLARKGLAHTGTEEPAATILSQAAGVVAGLACTFADSVWFNAVEAEVYGLSSFFTAIVVWLILKWEARADEPGNERWIVLIAYVMGLSIGVHLLNLLTIPALALVYYYRRFTFSWPGLLAAMGIAVAVLFFVQYGIIQYTFSIAWSFEKFFTGTVTRAGSGASGLGLPFGTGAAIFALLLIGATAGLIWYSIRRRLTGLNTAMMAFAVIMIGFSTYSVIFIRANVNPPVEMNNPENILTFLSYMRREQYGDRPLLRGPLYNATPDRDRDGRAKTEVEGMKYMMLEGKDRYIEDTETINYVFREQDKVWFPRMYQTERYNSGPFGYINYVKNKGKDPKKPEDDKPTKLEDWAFFFDYQVSHMYLRYFFWNFVGRVSDEQDTGWEDGLFRASELYKDNKGNNHFFFLPLFFGLLGIIWQLFNSRRDAGFVGMLFFFTGLAIIIYLNQYPAQPRERDYSFAGSFQTFAIWIGLGVPFLYELLRNLLKKAAPWVAGAICLTAPLLMLADGWDDHTRKGRYIDVEFARNLLNSCAPNAILFTGGDNDTFPLWYVQEVEGFRSDVRVVNLELLFSDWYIDQMKEAKNKSEALPIRMEKKDYAGDDGIVIYGYQPKPITLTYDKQPLLGQGVLNEEEKALISDTMTWDFKGRRGYIFRKDSVLIDIVRNVAAGNWERPVYFANTMGPDNFMDLEDYLRLEGMAFRLLPIKRTENTANDLYNGRIAQEIMARNMTENFQYTGLDDPAVHFDDHIREVIAGNYRNSFFRLCNSYAEQIAALRAPGSTGNEAVIAGKQAEIARLMAFAAEKIPETVIPKSLALKSSEFQMLNNAGMQAQADELAASLEETLMVNLARIQEDRGKIEQSALEMQVCMRMIQVYAGTGQIQRAQALAARLEETTGSPLGNMVIQQMLQQRQAPDPAP